MESQQARKTERCFWVAVKRVTSSDGRRILHEYVDRPCPVKLTLWLEPLKRLEAL